MMLMMRKEQKGVAGGEVLEHCNMIGLTSFFIVYYLLARGMATQSSILSENGQSLRY